MPKTTKNLQANRQMKFPEDRIALLKGSEQAADADKIVLNRWERFGRWKKGEEYRRALQEAMADIAKNNQLDEVTVQQFDTLCKMTGYARVDMKRLVE